MKPMGRIAFWAALAAVHYLLVFAAFLSSVGRGPTQLTSIFIGAAELLLVLAVAVVIAVSSARRARMLDWTVAPAFLGSALAFAATLVVALPVLSAISMKMALPAGPMTEGEGLGAAFAALSMSVPASLVAALAAAPVGAHLASGGSRREWSAVWNGQRWAAAGSVLAHAIVLQSPPCAVLAIPIVICLSGAGYLRAVGLRELANFVHARK